MCRLRVIEAGWDVNTVLKVMCMTCRLSNHKPKHFCPNLRIHIIAHNTTANPYCVTAVNPYYFTTSNPVYCVQANGRTALHFAAGWGQTAVTQQLLSKRCDVDLIDKAGMSRCFCPLNCI